MVRKMEERGNAEVCWKYLGYSLEMILKILNLFFHLDFMIPRITPPH